MDFIIGGVAGASATLFTNPIDVVKTRMQLQGELQARAHQTTKYRGMLHALYVIAKNDGVFALQKGLAPAMILGFCMNSVRLGLYHIAEKQNWTRDKDGQISIQRAMLWSSVAGGLSGITSNPASVVKTRIQLTAHPSIAVGRQHNYKGMLDGFASIYRAEGLRGFFAGVGASCMRIFVGSGAQLTTFSLSKEMLIKYEVCKRSPFGLAFLSSTVSGVAVAVAACPLDVATVRLYNQGHKDQLYHGIVDCARKIYRTEGFLGFYKGIWPLYLRIAPHTTISLVVWDLLNNIIHKNNGKSDNKNANKYSNATDGAGRELATTRSRHEELDKSVDTRLDIVTALGLYHVAESHGWTKTSSGQISVEKAAFWSGVSGGLSGFLTNPIFVVKTRIQAASHPSIAVGKQHQYNGMLDGFLAMYKTEGMRGFFAGVNATCVRVGVGSSVQLTTFSTLKEWLRLYGIAEHSNTTRTLIASIVSSVLIIITEAPLDVANTRLYNQGSGQLYKGLFDCLRKIYKNEGLQGLYKGVGPLYLRMAPHSTLSLVIWDLMNHMLLNRSNNKDR